MLILNVKTKYGGIFAHQILWRFYHSTFCVTNVKVKIII